MAITISLAIRGLYAVPEVLVLNKLRLCHDKLKETIPTLGEVGGHQLYPQDAAAGMKILAFFFDPFGTYTFYDRPTPCTTVYFEVHACYLFILSKCAARAAAECDVDNAA
jgi:hypothetical protein